MALHLIATALEAGLSCWSHRQQDLMARLRASNECQGRGLSNCGSGLPIMACPCRGKTLAGSRNQG
jgi:hypothetical protein